MTRSRAPAGQHPASRSAALVALCAAILVVGCVHPGRIEPALAACPAPNRSTGDWRAVAESAGVSFKIPAAFVEQPRDEGAHRWWLNGDFSEYIHVGFLPSSSPVAAMGRPPSPGMMEMTQCVDSIGGQLVLVQSWRTIGGTFRNGQRMDRYDVFAVVPVHSQLRLYVSSGSHRRDTQHTALALVRTIVVAPAPQRR